MVQRLLWRNFMMSEDLMMRNLIMNSATLWGSNIKISFDLLAIAMRHEHILAKRIYRALCFEYLPGGSLDKHLYGEYGGIIVLSDRVI
jgi:hypothetical protein